MCSGYFQYFYYGRMYCIVLVSEPKDIMIDRKRQKRAVMIRLENVCFAYEKEIALRYVDLHINRGDSIVIQGPNGCGKSTLIKLLNGIIFPSEGKYFYQGHEINEKALKNSQFAKWFHQQMGYVFQNADTQLFCGSVEEEITFGPVQMGLSEAEIKKRTEDCLRLFGLEKLRERPPYHLSGGEKRKGSLACILSLNPEVLILDEPLAGLDEKHRICWWIFCRVFIKQEKR